MRKNIILFIILVYLSSVYGGESIFGVIPHSLGIKNAQYSGNGMARSFEVGVQDSTQINFINYSLWTNLSYPSYSMKLSYKAALGDDGIKDNYFNDVANFEGAFIAIPVIKKKLIFGAGLQPFTSIEQRIKDSLDSEVNEELLLRGGLSKALFNISYRPFKQWGVGISYEYNFGKIVNNFRLDYNDEGQLPLKFNYEYRFYGHGLALSSFFAGKSFTLGMVYRPKETVDIRVQGETSSYQLDKGELQSLTLPQQINFGGSYRFANRFRLGGDFMYEGWGEEYTVNNKNVGDGFSNYVRLGVGIERLQSHKIFTAFKEKLDYRLGFYYAQLSLKSNGKPVKEIAGSFGLSVPIQRFKSHIDLYGIIGKRGNLPENDYEEMFFKFGFTISASERWFVQFQD